MTKEELLQKKLDIAVKALNIVYHDMKCWTFISKRDRRVLSVICEALKEIDLVGTSTKGNKMTFEELKEKCLKLGDELRDNYIWVPWRLELHKDGSVRCGDYGCLIAENRSYEQMWQIREAIQ